jgi:hypothetical protein
MKRSCLCTCNMCSLAVLNVCCHVVRSEICLILLSAHFSILFRLTCIVWRSSESYENIFVTDGGLLSSTNENTTPSFSKFMNVIIEFLLQFAAAKDRVLSSLTECARLKSLLPNAKRVILPERFCFPSIFPFQITSLLMQGLGCRHSVEKMRTS